jgi:hypothetical protein
MRIRILKQPPIESIDGMRFGTFREGQEYEVGNTVAMILLAEGWAEPVPLDAPAAFVPFAEDDPYDSRKLYPELPQNLKRETSTRNLDRAVATDSSRRRAKRLRHK